MTRSLAPLDEYEVEEEEEEETWRREKSVGGAARGRAGSVAVEGEEGEGEAERERGEGGGCRGVVFVFDAPSSPSSFLVVHKLQTSKSPSQPRILWCVVSQSKAGAKRLLFLAAEAAEAAEASIDALTQTTAAEAAERWNLANATAAAEKPRCACLLALLRCVYRVDI